MVTAIDTSVLLDVFGADREFGERSSDALQRCLRDGALVACDIVWAELGAWFPTAENAAAALDRLGVAFSPLDASAALAAGLAWRKHRRRGRSRERVVADFLIASHARRHADRLLTRDRGFCRRYFGDLVVIDPAAR